MEVKRKGWTSMAITDLVLEGGGAKLPGLVGAVQGLVDAGYSIHRVAGTSAGAIVGAMISAGIRPEDMVDLVLATDFARFEDIGPTFRFAPALGRASGLLLHKGMYVGAALHSFLHEVLADHGIHTWGDLRLEDQHSALPPERRYRLVVIVSDVSRGRMLRLPWDYRSALGVEPDRQSVAEAICASAATPFFFRPRVLRADPDVAGGRSLLAADGGILSNFPVGVFDRKDRLPARWPTLGVMLAAKEAAEGTWRQNASTFQYAISLLSTMLNAHDRRHIDEPSVVDRTIFVDTGDHSSTDFALTEADKRDLLGSGRTASAKFLSTWDWNEWKSRYGRR